MSYYADHVERIREALRAVIAQQAVVDAAHVARFNRDDPRSAHQKATALHNTQRKLRRLENEADDLIFQSLTTDALGREARNDFNRVLLDSGYTQAALDALDGLSVR